VPGFTDDLPVVLPSQRREEVSDELGVEGKTWRQLYQDWASLRSQLSGLVQEAAEGSVGFDQAALVGNLFWYFERECEVSRSLGCPPGVSGRPVRPVEARVDLNGVKTFGIPSQMASLRGETTGVLLGDRPAGTAHPELRW
jgi:hypothetical protein